jgi:uncharacterized protein
MPSEIFFILGFQMKIETDLKVIKDLAEKREKENLDFRTFLKGSYMEIEEMDEMVHNLYEVVVAHIDCKNCGNCCRVISPTMEEGDIDRMAKGIGISPSEVILKYLEEEDDRFSKDLIFNSLPCPFFEENSCTSYEYRPEACRSFPHLQKDEFVFRLMGVVQNYEICPIVFNVYEMLKKRFSWPKNSKKGRYWR